MPFEDRTAQPFEYWTNGRRLVFLCTGLVFEQLVQYIGNNPQTNHLKSKLQKVGYSNFSRYSNGQYSDPHCTQVPTVLIFNVLACLWDFWTSMKALDAFSSIVEKRRSNFFILSFVSRLNGTRQVLIKRSTSNRSSRPFMQ